MHRHLEGASGILGMIKAIMMLQHGCVLPNANFERFNESIQGRERLRVRLCRRVLSLLWENVLKGHAGGSNNDTMASRGTKASLCYQFR